MTVKADPQFAGIAIPGYGEYLGEYESDHAHAMAKLFRQNGNLVAYLTYDKRLAPEQISDRYKVDLTALAREKGLTLKVLHVA